MAQSQIRFEDGAAYDRMMGEWSRLIADAFLDWLAPLPSWRWADIGCGTGAFSSMLVERCAPAAVEGVDPSEAQLAFARARGLPAAARFQPGNALALPFADAGFDAAVMALVIFFVPDPAKGVAEMARIVRPGGIVAAYAWDLFGGGHPGHAIQAEMGAFGVAPMRPPSAAASQLDALDKLWTEGGLEGVETKAITASRTFADFEDYWTTSLLGSAIGPTIAGLPADAAARLKARVRERMPADASGRITCTGRVNAVKGRLPA
jgi:ubiquinone/menaquinone biosynthesis C-methylase UbiE